jgi:hypothetical protein
MPKYTLGVSGWKREVPFTSNSEVLINANLYVEIEIVSQQPSGEVLILIMLNSSEPKRQAAGPPPPSQVRNEMLRLGLDLFRGSVSRNR